MPFSSWTCVPACSILCPFGAQLLHRFIHRRAGDKVSCSTWNIDPTPALSCLRIEGLVISSNDLAVAVHRRNFCGARCGVATTGISPESRHGDSSRGVVASCNRRPSAHANDGIYPTLSIGSEGRGSRVNRRGRTRWDRDANAAVHTGARKAGLQRHRRQGTTKACLAVHSPVLFGELRR